MIILSGGFSVPMVLARTRRSSASRLGRKEWTIGTLVSRGVLTAFGERLGQEPSARCEFFSALSASHLQDLTESAPMAADLAEFEATFAAADKRASWDELCRAWPGVTREQAWRRLQRITVGTIDERSLRDILHAYARALVARARRCGCQSRGLPG